MSDGTTLWTGRRKQLEELRTLVSRLEDENADLLRMRAARLAEENERLSRGPDPWSVLSAEEERRYLADRCRFRAIASDDVQVLQSDGHR